MEITIFITGAGGYIGSVATYLFLQKGYSVVALDNFSTGYRGPLQLFQNRFGNERLRVVEADLRSPLDAVFDDNPSIEAVVHYAALCSVNESMHFPERYFSNNLCASQNLLHAMLAHDVKKIVFSSTCAVYGEADYTPIDEEHPIRPTNPYGASKKMTEELLGWYSQLKQLSYVSLRYFNVCGASDDGLVGDAKKPSPHLMQNAVRGALAIEPFSLTCPKVATPDKTPIRDYVNVHDLGEAHVLALDYLMKGGVSEVINLGTGTGNSVMEIIETVKAKTGKDIPIKDGETRKGEYATMIASTNKAKNVLGWQPKRTLEDSVQSMVKWYTARPAGWGE